MGRRDGGIDPGIDATPRGPSREVRRPSAWDEPMHRAFPRSLRWLAGLAGVAILGLVAEGAREAVSRGWERDAMPAAGREAADRREWPRLEAEAARARALLGHGTPADGLDAAERERVEAEEELEDVDGADLRPR